MATRIAIVFGIVLLAIVGVLVMVAAFELDTTPGLKVLTFALGVLLVGGAVAWYAGVVEPR